MTRDGSRLSTPARSGGGTAWHQLRSNGARRTALQRCRAAEEDRTVGSVRHTARVICHREESQILRSLAAPGSRQLHPSRGTGPICLADAIQSPGTVVRQNGEVYCAPWQVDRPTCFSVPSWAPRSNSWQPDEAALRSQLADVSQFHSADPSFLSRPCISSLYSESSAHSSLAPAQTATLHCPEAARRAPVWAERRARFARYWGTAAPPPPAPFAQSRRHRSQVPRSGVWRLASGSWSTCSDRALARSHQHAVCILVWHRRIQHPLRHLALLLS